MSPESDAERLSREACESAKAGHHEEAAGLYERAPALDGARVNEP
ncbi:MAG TPA: hypothetical protein VKU01_28580 [Bryobacteraceae bacterium]|nr:hypothetical protein [Bryobacteraceae bacterium]